jgi:hypothetical protein
VDADDKTNDVPESVLRYIPPVKTAAATISPDELVAMADQEFVDKDSFSQVSTSLPAPKKQLLDVYGID